MATWLSCAEAQSGIHEYREPRAAKEINKNIFAKLAEAGWGAGFALPFANEENRKLEEILEAKQKNFLALTNTLGEDTEHFIDLKKHLLRLEQTINASQNLLAAKTAEHQSELNAAMLAERYRSRQEKENEIRERLILEYSESVGSKLENFEKRRQIVLDLMALTEFNGRALQEWAAKTEDTQGSIEDTEWYKVMDNDKQKEMLVKSEDLSTKNIELRSTLYALSTDTLKLQDNFTRITSKFQKLNRSRQDLIHMWKNTLRALTKRDKDIQQVANAYLEKREDLRDLNSTIDDEERNYRAAKRLTQETRYETGQRDRELQKLREQLVKAKAEHEFLRQDYLTQRMTVSHMAGDLSSLKKNVERVRKERSDLEKSGAVIEAENIVYTSRLEEIKIGRDDENGRVATFNFILGKHEEMARMYDEDLVKFRVFVFELSYERKDMMDKIKKIDSLIHTNTTSIKKAIRQDTLNVDQSNKRKAVIFHLDLHIRSMFTKIEKLVETSSLSNDYSAAQTQGKAVHGALEKLGREKLFIQKNLRQNEIFIQRFMVHIRRGTTERENIKAQMFELELMSNGLEKGIKEAQEEIKELQVATSLQRVLLHRLEKQISEASHNMTGLSIHRSTLECAAKERKSEIEIHKNLDKEIITSLRFHIGELKGYVLEVNRNINKQKMRFGTISDLMNQAQAEIFNPVNKNVAKVSAGGGGGGIKNVFCDSITCVIKQRELLIGEKTQWEGRIVEAESELEGLGNAVKVMETANCAFRLSLAPADKTSPEYETMTDIESAEKTLLVRKHKSGKKKQKLLDEHSDLRISINMTKQYNQSLSFVCNAKLRYASKLSNELIIQRDKIIRSTNLIHKITLGLKKAGLWEVDRLEFIEADLKCRFLKEKYEFGVVMLEKLVHYHSYTKETVLKLSGQNKHMNTVKNRVTHVGLAGYKNSSRYAQFIQADPYISFVNDVYEKSESYHVRLRHRKADEEDDADGNDAASSVINISGSQGSNPPSQNKSSRRKKSNASSHSHYSKNSKHESTATTNSGSTGTGTGSSSRHHHLHLQMQQSQREKLRKSKTGGGTGTGTGTGTRSGTRTATGTRSGTGITFSLPNI